MEKLINQLIIKYEDTVKSAEDLKKVGTGSFSDAPTAECIRRLDARIYERETFIEDLKILLSYHLENKQQ